MLLDLVPLAPLVAPGDDQELLRELQARLRSVYRYQDGHEAQLLLRWGSRVRVVLCSGCRRVHRQTTGGSRIMLTRRECAALRAGVEAALAHYQPQLDGWYAELSSGTPKIAP